MSKTSHKVTIAVYGGRDIYDQSLKVMKAAENLGTAIADAGATLAMPTTTGFPAWVAKGAKAAKGQVIGFSPAAGEREHHAVYNLPTDHTDHVVYSGFGFAGADLLISRSCDAIVFGYGGLETVHEFWVAFQEGKPIGVLKGGWDTDEILFGLLKGHEATFDHHRIIFDDDPKNLVDQLVKRAQRDRTEAYHL